MSVILPQELVTRVPSGGSYCIFFGHVVGASDVESSPSRVSISILSPGPTLCSSAREMWVYGMSENREEVSQFRQRIPLYEAGGTIGGCACVSLDIQQECFLLS